MEFDPAGYDIGGFCRLLGVEFTEYSKAGVKATMPIGPDKWQPWGFVHGGATISFLESLASRASEYYFDPETEAAFGVDVHVRHRKPAKSGHLHGSSVLDREEPSSNGIGRKQYWNVEARDDEGDIISSGVIMTKVVPKSRLAEKEAEREAARAAQQQAAQQSQPEQAAQQAQPEQSAQQG